VDSKEAELSKVKERAEKVEAAAKIAEEENRYMKEKLRILKEETLEAAEEAGAAAKIAEKENRDLKEELRMLREETVSISREEAAAPAIVKTPMMMKGSVAKEGRLSEIKTKPEQTEANTKVSKQTSVFQARFNACSQEGFESELIRKNDTLAAELNQFKDRVEQAEEAADASRREKQLMSEEASDWGVQFEQFTSEELQLEDLEKTRKGATEATTIKTYFEERLKDAEKDLRDACLKNEKLIEENKKLIDKVATAESALEFARKEKKEVTQCLTLLQTVCQQIRFQSTSIEMQQNFFNRTAQDWIDQGKRQLEIEAGAPRHVFGQYPATWKKNADSGDEFAEIVQNLHNFAQSCNTNQRRNVGTSMFSWQAFLNTDLASLSHTKETVCTESI
jgi:hypothetical protein